MFWANTFIRILAVAGILLSCDLPTENARNADADADADADASGICPESPNEWQTWIGEEVGIMQRSGYTENAAYVFATLNQRCRVQHQNLRKHDICYDNLLKFTSHEALAKTNTHSLGLKISDEAYFNELTPRELRQLPQDALDLIGSISLIGQFGLSQVSALVAEKNKSRSIPSQIELLAFKSKHLNSVDDSQTKGRVLLMIPQDHHYSFVQFAVDFDDPQNTSNSISMISVQTHDFATKMRLPTPKAYFNDFWRVYQGESVEVSSRLKETGRLENCYSCHKSALLTIHPESQEGHSDALLRINQAISSLQNAQLDGFDTDDYGPSLGLEPSNAKSTQAFFECMGETEPRYQQRLLNQATCQSCHNGVDRGKLTYPSGLKIQLPNEISSLTEFRVTKRLDMPPTLNVTKDSITRETLHQCLTRDYYGDDTYRGKLFHWLVDPRCS